MTFQRTPLGVSNLHIFVDSDAVVYLEGGKSSFSIDQIKEGTCNNYSEDIKYWQKVFHYYFPDKDFHFKSVGSKSSAIEMAKFIQDNSIDNALVALDRDFDNLTQKIIKHPQILYTFGYSWENDCWSKISIRDAIFSIAGICKATNFKKVDQEVSSLLRDFGGQIKHWVRIDSIMMQNNFSLFDRKTPNRYIDTQSNKNKPVLNKRELKRTFVQLKQQVTSNRPFFSKNSVCLHPIHDCFGHLFAKYCYRVLIQLCKNFSANTGQISAHVANSIIIDQHIFNFSDPSLAKQRAYYDKSFHQIII